MENFTSAQRQEMYAHLLTLQCPDLLAALIANRVDRKFIDSNWLDKSDLTSWVMESFDWLETPEEFDFWNCIHDGVYDHATATYDTDKAIYDEINAISDDKVFGFVETTPSMSYALGDVVQHEGEKLVCNDVGSNSAQLTWFEKVKLFFGKWVYKV